MADVRKEKWTGMDPRRLALIGKFPGEEVTVHRLKETLETEGVTESAA